MTPQFQFIRTHIIWTDDGQIEDIGQAIHWCEQAAKAGYAKAQYNLAVALFHQKRYADAAKAYFKARDLDKEYVNRRDNSEHTRKKLQAALEQAAEDEESSKELKRMQKWLAPNY